MAMSAALAIVTLAGCTADSGGNDKSDDGGSALERESAIAAGVDLDEDLTPIASGTVTSRYPDVEILVEFHGLERRDNVVVGTYAFTVQSEGPDTTERNLSDWLGSDWRPAIIDPVNLNKHLPVRGDDGSSPLGQTQSGWERGAAHVHEAVKFPPGNKLWAFAVFAAPPDDVTHVDAIVSESFPVVPNQEIG